MPDPSVDPSRAVVAIPGLPAPAFDAAGARAGWAYSDDLGRRIAELYAAGEPGGLAGVHAAFPDLIPPPPIVRAWCRQFPQFGLRMRDAERDRAELLIEQTIVIADGDEGDPRRVALRIATRQRMAARLDARWSDAGTDEDTKRREEAARLGADPQPVSALSDEQLASIAAPAGGVGGETPR